MIIPGDIDRKKLTKAKEWGQQEVARRRQGTYMEKEKIQKTHIAAFMKRKHKVMARLITDACVRNTGIERIHAGIMPDSKTGDYSDVKVVSPYGEIPWLKLSRISEEEMRQLMLEIEEKVNSILNFFFEFSIKQTMELSHSFMTSPPAIGNHLPGHYFDIFNDEQELEKLEKYLFSTRGMSWDNPKARKRL